MRVISIIILHITIFFKISGFIFGQTELPKNSVYQLQNLMKPQTIVVGKEHIYITENMTVYIYDINDFRLIKKFGKSGEGPGEFRDTGFGIKLKILDNQILIKSQGRLSYFTKNGNFINEKQVRDPRLGQFNKIGDRYIGTLLRRVEKKVYFILNLYDKNLKKIKELYRYQHPFFPRNKKINPLNPRVCSFYVSNKNIYYDDQEGTIHICNSNGKKIGSVKPSYQEIKVDKKISDRYIDIWKTNLKPEYESFKNRFEFPSVCPNIRDFNIIENKIYIITFKEKNNKSQVLIYSNKGKFLKEIYLPLSDTDMLMPNLYNYYTIKNNKLFKLVENMEEESWEIHIVDI